LQQSVLINGQAYAYFYSYDSAAVQNGLGQLAQVQMPTATQNFTAYSRDGELQQESLVIDGLTYVQAYEYSPGGERTRLVYPDGAELNTGYDAAGNITTQDFKDNAQASSRQVANYSRYSAGNQVLNVAFANGVNTAFDYFSYAENMARPKSMIVTLSGGVAYSNAYDWNQVGQLAASTTLHGNNPSVKYVYRYDAMGWLKQANGPYGILDYNYDVAGNIILKDGVTYTYAPHTNHLTGASNGMQATHDEAGNVSSLIWPDASWNYDYNNGGNLEGVRLNGVSKTVYLYDFMGNRLKRSDASGDVSLYVSADFDVTISNGQTLYTRYVNGPDGRIAASTVNRPTPDTTVGAAGFGGSLQQPDPPAMLHKVKTLMAGLLATSSAVSIVWIALWVTMLSSLWLGFKAAGRPKLANSVTGGKVSVWRYAATPWLMLSFLTATWPSQTAAELGAGGGLPTTGDLYFNTDSLGSSVLVTNAAGNESSIVAYLPYGGLDQGNSSGPNDFRPKFTGAEFDQAVGLNYMGARYQHPVLGRFLQPDPANQFASPYTYVGNDPLTLTDPNGEFVQLLILAAVAVIGAYSGAAAVNHEMDPSHWDWRKGNTYAGLFAGAAIGAAGGAVGAAAFEVGVEAGIAGAITVGAGEGAAYSALGGGSARDMAVSSLMGGAFGGLTAGVGVGVDSLAGSASRMMARGENTLLENSAGAVRNRSLSLAESGSENEPLLSPADGANCYSFAAGTQIAVPGGVEDITQIRVGDTVLAMPEQGVVGAYPVLALHQRDAQDIIEIRVEGGTLVTTHEHPFLTQAQRWVKAYQLKAGDLLQDSNGQFHPVEKVTTKEGSVRVYNFEVAQAHNYFAGDHDKQVLVHNVTCKVGDVAVYKVNSKNGKVGDKLTPDHIPSNAANIAFAEKTLGRDLTAQERSKLNQNGMTIMVTEADHKGGFTFGAKNIKLYKVDGANDSNYLAAAKRDMSYYVAKKVFTPAKANFYMKQVQQQRSLLQSKPKLIKFLTPK
jgi:RHS repeat-associated protein